MDPDQVNIKKQCDPLRRETVTLLLYNMQDIQAFIQLQEYSCFAVRDL